MRNVGPVIGMIAAGIIFVLYNSLFIVDQREQAIITQFGNWVRTVKEPGLGFKTPFIQTVTAFDKRVLELDAADTQRAPEVFVPRLVAVDDDVRPEAPHRNGGTPRARDLGIDRGKRRRRRDQHRIGVRKRERHGVDPDIALNPHRPIVHVGEPHVLAQETRKPSAGLCVGQRRVDLMLPDRDLGALSTRRLLDRDRARTWRR